MEIYNTNKLISTCDDQFFHAYFYFLAKHVVPTLLLFPWRPCFLSYKFIWFHLMLILVVEDWCRFGFQLSLTFASVENIERHGSDGPYPINLQSGSNNVLACLGARCTLKTVARNVMVFVNMDRYPQCPYKLQNEDMFSFRRVALVNFWFVFNYIICIYHNNEAIFDRIICVENKCVIYSKHCVTIFSSRYYYVA